MALIPVLIVDDEYLIRSLIRNSLDWEGLGFRIVGEAEDGETALKLVEELKPRLLILDINIPFLNGLEVSRRLRSSRPDVKIIILTGYEDFQYALQAIKAGVLNYILKPINAEEFQAALGLAREVIRSEGKTSLPDFADAEVGLPARERFFRLLVTGGAGFPEKTVADRFRLFKTGLSPENFVTILFDVRRLGEGKTVRALEQDLQAFLARLPSERLKALPPYELFPDEAGRLVLLVNDDPLTSRRKDKAFYPLAEVFRAAGREAGLNGCLRHRRTCQESRRPWAVLPRGGNGSRGVLLFRGRKDPSRRRIAGKTEGPASHGIPRAAGTGRILPPAPERTGRGGLEFPGKPPAKPRCPAAAAALLRNDLHGVRRNHHGIHRGKQSSP